MKARALTVVLVVTAGLSVGPASAMQGICFPPRAPSALLTKPHRPFCAASRSCSSWEVDSYRLAVENHFRNLRDYATEVDRFYSRAADYIECMARLD